MTTIYILSEDIGTRAFTHREAAIAEARLAAVQLNSDIQVLACTLIKASPRELAVKLLDGAWAADEKVIKTIKKPK